jgi:FSR family fosmidomycin resistance protein-like MFS transporter
VAALLAIELLDELVFGAREAAWPLIRDDFSLSYTQIGLLLSVPNLVALVVEPVLGLASVTGRPRPLVVGGGVCFAVALGLAAAASSFWLLLVAFSLLYSASGAFVSLSQAALMDLEPDRREHNMARWTLAGGVGVVIGPLALAGLVWAGLGWRELFAGFAVLGLALVLLLRRSPDSRDGEEAPRLRDALRSLRRREVFRWLLLLELSDLLGDVLLGFLALYFVDAVGSPRATGGLAVAVWSGAGLAGAAAMIPLLRRVDGGRYLRVSAVLAAILFAAFLLAPGVEAKLVLVAAVALVNAGWYPVLKARLYGALDGQSGLVLTVGALFPLNVLLPLGIAAAAELWGLEVALWPLLVAPLALLLLVPRDR